MTNLWIALLGFVLVWAGHAPAVQVSEAPSLAVATSAAHSPQKESFWKRLKGWLYKPIAAVKGSLKRLLLSEQDLIRLLIIILIVALIISILVWLLPWPLDVIIMVLALVVALIFLLRYL